MKIMIYDCDGITGIHEERIATEINRETVYNGYSLKFGEYELIIVPSEEKDIENLKYRFSEEFRISYENVNMKILLKKNGILFRSGKYLYDEINEPTKDGKRPKSLSFWVEYSNKEEGQIIFSIEGEESLLSLYNKIFLRK